MTTENNSDKTKRKAAGGSRTRTMRKTTPTGSPKKAAAHRAKKPAGKRRPGKRPANTTHVSGHGQRIVDRPKGSRGKQSTRTSGKGKKRGYKRNSRESFRALMKIKENTALTFVPNEKQIEQVESLPPLEKGNVRVVPICGTQWIGTNMIMVEYDDEIVIIDAGFGFSNVATPGIDYTIPNISYLSYHRDKIVAMVITHGHLDHVGGIPYVLDALGNPPIYTREFGGIFIQKKLEEFPHLADTADLNIVDPDADYIKLSDNFKVKFFGLTHSIPDSSGVIVQTPLGGIVSTGDVRVESQKGIPVEREVEGYKFFKDENILMLLMDSTNIENQGWSLSEDDVSINIDSIIKNVPGRIFIAAFSSQVERLMQFMISAMKHGKYVVLEGRSIVNNMGIAKHLQLTDFSHVIPISEMDNYPDNKLVILVTGAQGEQYAALNRIANETHTKVRLRETDTILLSSSIVPGNHYPVTQLKNNLYKGSYNVITYKNDMVHASGHGNREELKWIHTQIPYKYFMPVHGEPYMTRMHADMVTKELGLESDRLVVPDDGTIVEVRDEGKTFVRLDQKVPAETIIVDGSYVGPLQKVVMDDRLALSETGMFVVVVSIDIKKGKLKKSPDIISRGYIYLRESKDLLNKVRTLVKRNVEAKIAGKKHVDFDELKDLVTEKVSKYLLQHTQKEPIVIPVVLGV